jgi:hypothetical protein
MKRIVLAATAALALAFSVAIPALATKPAPSHKVTICHATPPDTAANGWVAITVDIASTGYKQSGHQDQHDADIIPAYNYRGVFVYNGKNLDTYFYGALGSDILANGCVSPSESVAPSESATPSEMAVTPSLPEASLNLKAPNTATLDPVSSPGTPIWPAILLGVATAAAFVLLPSRSRRIR